jgi:secretion/DNA translocation related TadE-like protein
VTDKRAENRGDESGSVAVLMCGLIALAVVLIVAITALGGAVVLAGRAEAAADAAALAAADSVALGRAAVACDSARSVAAADRATVIECAVEPDAVEVLVELTDAPPSALGRAVRARSRAEVDFSGLRGGGGG